MAVKISYSKALALSTVCTLSLLSQHDAGAAAKAKPAAAAPKGCEVDPALVGAGERVQWQGGCADGKPDGKGVLTWFDKKRTVRTFTGELKAGLPQGDGQMSFADGSRYVGQFSDGKFHGNGNFTLASGDHYSGVFAAGALLEAADYFYANGDRYVGPLADHVPNGFGTYYLTNGESYEGRFTAGVPGSTVVYRFANGARFEGPLIGGRPGGKGVLYIKDDERVEGLFAAGEINGEGRYVYSSGKRFEGTLEHSQPHGAGVLFLPDGSRIKGTFETNGMPSGPVVLDYANQDHYEGALANLLPDGPGSWRSAAGLTYNGAFKQGARTGEAKIAYVGGASYQGSVKNGMREGAGEYTWAGGATYKGEFRAGLPHGSGELRWPDGRHYKGQFAAGLPSGAGLLERPDGWRYEGGFEQGVLSGAATLRMPNKSAFVGSFINDQRAGQAALTAADGEKTELQFAQDVPKEDRGPYFSMFKNKEEELTGLVTDGYYGWALRYYKTHQEHFNSRRDKVQPLLDRLGEGLVWPQAMRIDFLALGADMLLADGELANLASVELATQLLGQAQTELGAMRDAPLAANTPVVGRQQKVLEAVLPALPKAYLAMLTTALSAGRHDQALKILAATRRVDVEVVNPKTVAAFNDFLVRQPERIARKNDQLEQLIQRGFAPDQARLTPALESKLDQVLKEGDLQLALGLVSAADTLKIKLMTPARVGAVAQLLAGRVRTSRDLALPFGALPKGPDATAVLGNAELQRAWIEVLAGRVEQSKVADAVGALKLAREAGMKLPAELANGPLTRALKLCLNRYEVRTLLSMLAELPAFNINLTPEFKKQVVFLRSGTTGGNIPFPLNVKNETGLTIMNADDFLDSDQEALDLLQQYEYVVLLDIHPRHTERRLKQRKQTKSSFNEGMEEVVNPEYQRKEAELRNASAQLAQAQQSQAAAAAAAANSGGGLPIPGLGGRNGALAGALFSALTSSSSSSGVEQASAQANSALNTVQVLQSQLGRMPRTIKQPVKVDYRYEELKIDIVRNVPVTAYIINRGEGNYVSRRLALVSKEELASTLGVHSKDKTAKRLERLDRIRQIERTPVTATMLGLLGTEQLVTDADAPKDEAEAADSPSAKIDKDANDGQEAKPAVPAATGAEPAQLATTPLERLPTELAENRDSREQSVMQALDASNQNFDKAIHALLPSLHEDARARDEQVVEMLLQAPDIPQRSGRDARRLANMLIKLAASKKTAAAPAAAAAPGAK